MAKPNNFNQPKGALFRAPQLSACTIPSRLNQAQLRIVLAFLISCCFSSAALSESNVISSASGSSFRPIGTTKPDFLPVEQAFKLDINQVGDKATLVWTIAPGYYLYKHKFEFSGKTGDESQPLSEVTKFSRGIRKRDDYFGPVEVFYHQATAELTALKTQQLIVKYQGCADAGLCYPVQTKTLTLPAP